MRRELSDCKSRFKIQLNSFSLTTKIFKMKHMLNRRSYHQTNLHDASKRPDHIELVLADMISTKNRLSRFKRTRHKVLKDSGNHYNDYPNYMEGSSYEI